MLPPARIVNYLANCLGADDPLESVLAPLLTTRVPDTEGNTQARLYISQVLADLGWNLEVDTFSQDTVIGEKTFHNIIATRNKDSPRRLGKQDCSTWGNIYFIRKYRNIFAVKYSKYFLILNCNVSH